jgi:hypothetical protein
MLSQPTLRRLIAWPTGSPIRPRATSWWLEATRRWSFTGASPTGAWRCSAENSAARVLDLEPSSIEANRKWFAGNYAPAQGATVGLRTILAARHVLIMAYGAHKAKAVEAMINGPRSAECPASFLQCHPDSRVFVDEVAAAKLDRQR